MPRADRPHRRCRLAWLAAVLLAGAALARAESPRVAVVVDDLGNQRASGLAAIAVPYIQTVAIMPGRPYSEELARVSHDAAKTVMVHAPMSNQSDFPLGPLGLDREEGRERLLANLWAGLDSVPHAEGLSNHMGSRLTRDAEAMGWIMTELRGRGLFFFDSLTISDSQGWRMAEAMGVPWHRRQVFLDHERDADFMERQWRKALALARRYGSVTVICHPYPETLAFFASLDPDDYPDIDWVSLKELLHRPATTAPAPVQRPHGTPRSIHRPS